MKTPKLFTYNLKHNIITEKMLEQCLYSLNKRAKNCRDKKQEYYYIGKEMHSQYAFDSVNMYKYKEQEYYNLKNFLLLHLLNPICIHIFNNIKFLFFTTTNNSFHIPNYNLCSFEWNKYSKNLKEEKIYNFITYGKEINDLISVQFCKKIVDKIKSNNFKYIND